MKAFVTFLNFFFIKIYLLHKIKIINYLKKWGGENKSKVIFDVGAYMGDFGHSFKKSKVFFIEPNIYRFEKIKKIKKNRYFNVGLGSKYAKKTFYISPNDSASSIKKKKTIQFKDFFLNLLGQKIIRTNIKIYPLNFYIKKYNVKKIYILKIDTEGYEEEVLKGISKKNFKKIEFVIIEKCLNKDLYYSYSFKRINKILINNNFIFLKKFKDTLWNYEDHIYLNKPK